MANFLANRFFLMVLVVLSIAVSLGIMFGEMTLIYDGLVSGQVSMAEDTLAVLFVGVGVLLEGREVFTEWIAKRSGEETSEEDEELGHQCGYYGMLILSIGLLIEIIDQALNFVETFPYVIVGVQLAINLPLNIYGIFLLGVVFIKLLKVKPENLML